MSYPTIYREPLFYIEGGEGVYTLYVGDSPVAKIDYVNGHRELIWQIYGPCDLARSIAIAKGLVHLVVLLGNEEQVNQTPAALESSEFLGEVQNGKTKRRPQSPRTGSKRK